MLKVKEGLEGLSQEEISRRGILKGEVERLLMEKEIEIKIKVDCLQGGEEYQLSHKISNANERTSI